MGARFAVIQSSDGTVIGRQQTHAPDPPPAPAGREHIVVTDDTEWEKIGQLSGSGGRLWETHPTNPGEFVRRADNRVRVRVIPAGGTIGQGPPLSLTLEVVDEAGVIDTSFSGQIVFGLDSGGRQRAIRVNFSSGVASFNLPKSRADTLSFASTRVVRIVDGPIRFEFVEDF